MYEKPVSPAPDPGSWFRAKIVIEERVVNAYVNDAKSPTLAVTALSEPRAGMVGLWVGNASPGDFANLTLTPRRPWLGAGLGCNKLDREIALRIRPVT
jgi:hypothetical protein